MKKIISLIAIVVSLVVLSTNVFAFSLTGAVTNAELDGTTIYFDPTTNDSFIFECIADADVTGGTTTVTVSNLTSNGWTIEPVDGLYAYTDGLTVTANDTKVVVKFPSGTYESNGKAVMRFKAIPSDEAKYDITFQVSPMFNVGGLYNTKTTYTIAKKPVEEAEAPTYTEVTDGEGVFQGVKDIYTGVWTGAYTVTLNGNAADKVKVDFDAEHSYEVEADAAGEGAIAFKIAVVGAPKNAKAVPSVFGTEWVAAVKAE